MFVVKAAYRDVAAFILYEEILCSQQFRDAGKRMR